MASYVQDNYQSVPSEWSTEQWGFFAAMMFAFGMINSLFCLFCVFPCCCPRVMRTTYAKLISYGGDSKTVPLIEKGDSKNVSLIEKGDSKKVPIIEKGDSKKASLV